MTRIIKTVTELQSSLAGKRVGAVFTMGALHQGHAQLIKQCRDTVGKDAIVVVTIFVNPTQFENNEDLEKYPRDLASDVEICEQNSADFVFAPTVDEIYPPQTLVKKIEPGEIANILEGASRPGHFSGVATVVNRLLEIIKPSVTCFGEKDYQQLTIVRQIVKELSIPVEVIGVETVRESDGLAKSSRNRRLSEEERALAPHLYEAVNRVKAQLLQNLPIEKAISSTVEWLADFPEIELDYLTVLSPSLGKPVPGLARVLVAARIGDVRLIDNIECELAVANV
jgi:pantoate--beta-alanine ligase